MNNELVVISRDDLEELMRDTVIDALSQYNGNKTPSDSEKQYYTTQELMKMWSVSNSFIWRLEQSNVLIPVRIGRRKLYPKDVVDALPNITRKRAPKGKIKL